MPMLEKKREVALVRRAKRGDAEAMEALIRAHQEALYAFLLRMSGRPHIAEDIAQEAFVRVLKNLDRFDSRFRFSTWLFTIAKRLFVNAMQKHRPVYDSDTVSAFEGSGEDAPSDGSEQRERLDGIRGVLDAGLESLNEQQREIVLLFHQLSWSITDIAEHLDMPEGTVKSHLHRARRRMRKAIEADHKQLRQAEELWT